MVCASATGSPFEAANTTFGPGSCVTDCRYDRFVTMNESFGADGNSCTIPTTWKGTTLNEPVARSSTRSLSRSPSESE